MADTLANVQVGPEWQAVSVLTDGAVAAGTGCIIQNQSGYRMYAAISADEPASDIVGIIIPPVPDRPLHIASGESEVWIMTKSHFSAPANIQVA